MYIQLVRALEKSFLYLDVSAGIVYFLTLTVVYLFILERNLPSWLSVTTNKVI